MAEELSKAGTLAVCEDHDETYYVFDEEQDIMKILGIMQILKTYDERKIIRARIMFR
jgi:hypothetical protein